MTEKKCTWKFIAESALSQYQDYFETSCNHFNTYFAKVQSRNGKTGIKFCCFCGGKIKFTGVQTVPKFV